MREMGRYIGGGLSSIGLGGTAIGTGYILGNVVAGISRNPTEKDELFKNGMIFFSLVEAIALFSIVICILILYG
jgi:F-type H+-transporting ATPase subunit c